MSQSENKNKMKILNILQFWLELLPTTNQCVKGVCPQYYSRGSTVYAHKIQVTSWQMCDHTAKQIIQQYNKTNKQNIVNGTECWSVDNLCIAVLMLDTGQTGFECKIKGNSQVLHPVTVSGYKYV